MTDTATNLFDDLSNPKTDAKVKTQNAKILSRPSFKKDKIDAHYDRLPWFLAALGRIFGLKFAPISIPIERRLQTLATFMWMSLFLFFGFGSLFVMIYMFFYTQYWWISFSYFTFYLGDRTISERGGRRINALRNCRLWKHFANFFPIKIIKTCDYDTSKNYIFGYHPHGILSAGAACNFGTEGSGFSKLFPGLKAHLITLGGHFYLPLYRDFVLAHGLISCSKESLNYLLGGNEKGNALCLVVGGAVESLDSHPGTSVLHLKNRKGFCKVALRNGASLVPTYSFGETEVYEQVTNPKGSFVRRLQDGFQKIFGLAPCLFLGRGIFQYSFGIVPFRKPINTVFGKPIDVPLIKNPTNEDVCNLHDQYVKALSDIYNEHKETYAEFPEADLKIV